MCPKVTSKKDETNKSTYNIPKQYELKMRYTCFSLWEPKDPSAIPPRPKKSHRLVHFSFISVLEMHYAGK